VIRSATPGDSSGPLVPNGPGIPAPAPAPASAPWRDIGISCNMIAGLAHDHLFVGWEQGEQARALLSEL
jgi:hypothetical protein